MKCLAFDTSLSACSVAVLNHNQTIVLQQIAPKQQAQIILSMVEEALLKANLTLSDLDAIAYTCGPGSFTGIRIASSVAQGLAFPNNTPIVQISSLAALAQSAYDEQQANYCVVALDARMNQVFWAEYECNATGLVELVGNEVVSTPNEMSITIPKDYYAIGDGWQAYGPVLLNRVAPEPIKILPNQIVSPEAVLKLAISKYNSEGGINPNQALPVYLR